jgi:hypothetical protein
MSNRIDTCQLGDRVRVYKERGHGEGMHKIEGIVGRGYGSEFLLKSEATGERFKIYQAHCYRTIQDVLEASKLKRYEKEKEVGKILSKPKTR